MTRLFIEGRELELDNTIQVALTKQFENLSDPTAIINEWSKTISVPFTSTNNNIFGHIYNIDRLTVTGSSSQPLAGIYFDPYKKLDMRLQWGDSVLMTGYAKMNEIKQTNRKGTYELTLFGQLGRVLQELKKITFDTTSPDTEHIIDGSEYIDEHINKDLVYSSWTTEGQTYSKLYPKWLDVPGARIPHPAHKLTDIIGFAPNNSFDSGFDYSAYQTLNNGVESSNKFTQALADAEFEQTTGVAPDTVIPNGLFPREIGEYRSYLQIPFIYWNKLFQVFQYKAESLTGYTFDLDSFWFNDDNPYWHDLVYILNRRDYTEKNADEGIVNDYVPRGNSQIYEWSIAKDFWNNYSIVDYSEDRAYEIVFDRGLSDESIKILANDNLTIDLSSTGDVSKTIRIALPFDLRCPGWVSYGKGGGVRTGKRMTDNALIVTVKMVDAASGVVMSTHTTAVNGEGYSVSGTYDNIINYDEGNERLEIVGYSDYGDNPIKDRIYRFKISAPFSTLSVTSVKFVVSVHWVDDDAFNQRSAPSLALANARRSINITFEQNTRTDSKFTLNDLWNNDVNIFDEIIRYCKMHRILINVDDVNKKICFKHFSTYFQDYSVVDWTNKVDKSRDFNVKPVTLGEKYVVFNTDSNKTKLSSEYNEQVGLTYGSYRLVTDYNFNDSEKNLFKGCKESIANTDNVLSWTNLYDNKRVVYSLPDETYVYCKDKDGKFVNGFGEFFFYKGLKAFNTEQSLALRSVLLSDDTPYMTTYKNYFYVQGGDTSKLIQANTYPLLDILSSTNELCTFVAPMKSYKYVADYSGRKGVYGNFWEQYINERYNIQNKIITCYVDLKVSDYINFKWNKFVKIGNQLCIVNKIYDYDITSNEPTKVELITVQDLNAYVNKPYQYGYIRLSTNNLTVPYDHYRKVTVNATGDWEIRSTDWTDFLDIYPSSGGAGETTVYIGALNEDYGHGIYFDLLDSEGEVVKTNHLEVEVGGSNTLSAEPWFNNVGRDTPATVTITSSTPWRMVELTDGNFEFTPLRGGSGTSAATISNPSGIDGMSDFYIENDDGDIVTVRGYTPRSLISVNTEYLEIPRGSSAGLVVTNDSNASWAIQSSTGAPTVNLSPVTGAPRTQTNVTVSVPADSAIGEKEIVFNDNAGNNYKAYLTVNVI